MPVSFLRLAAEAAAEAGYQKFSAGRLPDQPLRAGRPAVAASGQERARLRKPIVSVSLGLPAVFQFGGLKRPDAVAEYALRHGDVAVWGGASRLFYHGIATLKDGFHPKLGRMRINLTLRRAL